MKHRRFIFLIFCIAFLLAACSDKNSSTSAHGDDAEDSKEKDETVEMQFSDEEVTVRVATPWGEDYFMNRIGEYAEKQLPHITIEHIDWDGSVENLEELYAGGTTPDVFLAFTGQQPLEKLDSVFPLDDMLESYGIDLSHLQPLVLEEIRSRDKERRLIGIPQETGVLGLYYNKEVFDLFGKEYPNPDESMSWDEVMDLSASLTGERNGNVYCGLDMDLLEMAPLWELSANMTDSETGDVLLTSDPKFTQYMKLMERFYNIQGNQAEECSFGGKTTAMKIDWHGLLAQWGGGNVEDVEKEVEYLEPIDIAPIPTWPDAPEIGPSPRGIHPWVINNHSDQKEAALQFILAGATEDYQLQLSRIGTPSALNTAESIEEFGAENDFLPGKNIEALFHTTPAEPPEFKSIWDQFVTFDFEKYQESGVDINEFLRITEEESVIKIKEEMDSQED
ncbi:ABC transporter substrate-binding protein [Bacillus sp. SD088]|uniref:ABC transporter substrate-binding protein n=1 Tax=Bacillus sp. SD088 TaxID=2782012 RepID=UPI001A95683D|nr:extracellular solute-binding protein [Bacillus sp. SD088]MBO0992297.1 extracellular solute-binding protein [Bacillus sp. SD088]